ncbi:hypothetical protein ACNS7O_15890 (plasmid) [Haloferacaceae archaeon DSL9]
MRVPLKDRLREPEYTGKNRCEPCTISNVGIAAVLGFLAARKSKPFGMFVACASALLIYLRGYLIPGTPALTQRYLPQRVLRWFGKESEPAVASGLEGPAGKETDENGASTAEERPVTVAGPAETEVGRSTNNGGDGGNTERSAEQTVDMESYLLEHGLVEARTKSKDLHLTDAFETAWFDETGSIRADEVDVETIVDAFGLDADSAKFESVVRNDGVVLRSDGVQTGSWSSRTALVADIAASRVLESRISGWRSYDYRQKGKVLNSLRMFLDRCPDGSDVRLTEERVESCCRPHTVFAAICEDTDERLFEHAVE